MEYLRRRGPARSQRNGGRHSSPPAGFHLTEALLSPESVVRLQRLAGNTAVAALIEAASQRQPQHCSEPARVSVQRQYSGIAKEARMRTLKTALAGLTWGDAPASRLAGIAQPALSALADASVPSPTVKFGDPGGGFAAIFRPVPWSIVVRQSPRYDAALATRAEMQELGGQLVHEARHADQYYLAARLLYGLPTRNAQQKSLLASVREDIRDRARAHQIAAPSIFGKAKYRAAMAKVSGMVTDVAQADVRAKGVADGAAAIRTFIQELNTKTEALILLGDLPDSQARGQQRQWRLAKMQEGEGLREAYRDALVAYTFAGTESDAFDIQMRAQGKTFDAPQEAERIADEKYQEARDLLTGMERYEKPPAVAPAAAVQSVQRHAIPEDIAAVE
ncbi:MAG: hypothetical protein QOD01_1976 [Actinomycetota bacterium]|nr:hypothetical protein [Actinomycetota bacterium]